jgi:hypothetical protein
MLVATAVLADETVVATGAATSSEADLAKQLANPVASLISLPF